VAYASLRIGSSTCYGTCLTQMRTALCKLLQSSVLPIQAYFCTPHTHTSTSSLRARTAFASLICIAHSLTRVLLLPCRLAPLALLSSPLSLTPSQDPQRVSRLPSQRRPVAGRVRPRAAQVRDLGQGRIHARYQRQWCFESGGA
jgi:hypothetical protein